MRKEVTIWRVMSKKLLIAGGGIGGMAAALAAARAGWQVQVLERASAFSEVGAGVQIGPNVTRVLHAWGLQEALRAVAAFPDALLVRDAASGAELGYMQLGERAQRLYGAPYATIHRADLHQALAAAAQAESQVQVHAGQALARYEDQGAAVQAFSVSQTWQRGAPGPAERRRAPCFRPPGLARHAAAGRFARRLAQPVRHGLAGAAHARRAVPRAARRVAESDRGD